LSSSRGASSRAWPRSPTRDVAPARHLVGRDRESPLEGGRQVLKIGPVGAGHRELEDVRHIVRMLAGEVLEERANLSG
jgi:hypothetical protein